MNIIALNERQDNRVGKDPSRVFLQLRNLLTELNKRQLPANIVEEINQHVQEINSYSHTGRDLAKLVKQKQTVILALLEKKLKIVPMKHYTKRWLAAGMSVFGLPMGVAFGLSLGNMGFLAIGLPMGMGMGAAVGSAMDRKALQEGRQLDVEIR